MKNTFKLPWQGKKTKEEDIFQILLSSPTHPYKDYSPESPGLRPSLLHKQVIQLTQPSPRLQREHRLPLGISGELTSLNP